MHCSWVHGSLQRHIDIQLSAVLPNEPLTTVSHQQSVFLRNALPVSSVAAAPILCS